MAEKLKQGDLVEVTVVGMIEGEHESGYTVRIHGDLVPVLRSQVRLMSQGDPEPTKEEEE